jgi:hypothetical protein
MWKQLHKKDNIDLYSIEVFTSAFAHYILIRLQKSEKNKKEEKDTWSSPSSSSFLFTCNERH